MPLVHSFGNLIARAHFTLDGPRLTLVTAPTEVLQQDTRYTCVDHIHPDMLPSEKHTVLF